MILTESQQSAITDAIDTALRPHVDPADDRSSQNYWAVVGAAQAAAVAVLESAFTNVLLKAAPPQPEQAS